MSLGDIWFVLIGVLFAGYALFDGFDLGVGTLYPFLGKSEQDKEVMRRAIGPVWDGNEVWLLTGGGALFAAFPAVYATVFSGFYIALMLLLFALIFRAVSLEFRHADPEWAKLWDGAFFLGSAIPALLFGVAVGNIIRGVPITAAGEMIAGGGDPKFLGNLFAALNPYSLIIGVVGLVWILAHGASWMALKSTGDLQARSAKLRRTLVVAWGVLLVVAAAASALLVPYAFENALRPGGIVFALVAFAGVGVALFFGAKGQDRQAWYGTALGAVGMVGLWAASIFPSLVPALEGSAGEALTIANAASSDLTLTVMLIIAGIGVPLVLGYTAFVYRTYAGRIEPAAEGEHY